MKEAYGNWSSLEEVDGLVNETALLTQGTSSYKKKTNCGVWASTRVISYFFHQHRYWVTLCIEI